MYCGFFVLMQTGRLFIYLFIYLFLPWKWSIYLLVLSVAKSVQKRFGQVTLGPEN